MATASILEFSELRHDAKGQVVPVAQLTNTVEQSVTFTTSTQSATFDGRTRYIRIVADAKAYFRCGTNPTATAAGPWIAADSVEYFGVRPGQKIAFYDGTS